MLSLFVRVALAATILATSAAATAKSTDAPADEYFGPFKYSAISVRMKINMLARSYNERWADDASIVHDALLIESSYRVWAQRYPQDRWLAPTAFHLAQLYQNLQTDDARSHARAMFGYVAKTFPASKEGHLSRLRLAQGFPALHAESPVSPTPSPYGPASPSASPAASGAPAPPAGNPSSGPPAAASAVPSPAAASPKPSASPVAASPKPSSSPKP